MPLFRHLNITNPRERALVGTLDASLSLASGLLTRRGRTAGATSVQRVLAFRLERIGDLIMTLDALAALREGFPRAHIALAVGRWNVELAALIPYVDEVVELSLPWIARYEGADSWRTLVSKARALGRRGWDLGINFEPDIRSNTLLALTRARHRWGFSSGGGGPLLTRSLVFDPARHTSLNAHMLVSASDHLSTAAPPACHGKLVVPDEARQRVDEVLRTLGVAATGIPLVVVHVSGGRPIKQWPPERFSEAVGPLSLDHEAFIVYTGTDADRGLVEHAMSALPRDARACSVVGKLSLTELAALLERATLLVTGDTGPMHLAGALGTPVVAVFGPSAPTRYGPTHAASRVVRIDLPCSPCNRIRQPPERCQGHTPDCLAGVTALEVERAARELWQAHPERPEVRHVP